MAERFKLVNKSRINNNRVRLIKTGSSTTQLDPLFGAIYENEAEVGLCLSPNAIISCVGAKVESDTIILNGDDWAVEVDGVILEVLPTLTYQAMVDLLESKGIRVTELQNAITHPIYCDGAVTTETLKMQDGGWLLEVDGVDMGGPYELAALDEFSRRREVRITVPEPVTCNIDSISSFTFMNLNIAELSAIIDAETGLSLMTSDDAANNEYQNAVVRWTFDPNYGAGQIQNRTDRCLLIRFQASNASASQWINAGISYEPDGNANVVERDGIYYISLAPVEYGDYILRYEMVDGNGTIPNNEGGQAGNVSVRFTGQSSGEFNPAGLHFNFMGTDYTIYSETDAIIVPVERIVPNTFFSKRYFVVRNDITLISPDVLLIGSNYDYDLAQPTNYWDAYAHLDGNRITVTVNGTITQFDGNFSILSHPDMQRPTIRAGDSIIVQAKTFYGGSHVCFGTNAKWNMGTLDSTGKLEFTIPLNQNNFTTFSFYDPNMIDEREYPNDYGFAELRYFNFSL